MTRQLEAYECKLCGNIVEVIHAGAGELVCCGQAMEMSAPVAAIVPIRDNKLTCKDKLA